MEEVKSTTFIRPKETGRKKGKDGDLLSVSEIGLTPLKGRDGRKRKGS